MPSVPPPMTPESPPRRPPLVPSHVAWPAFVVFLLAISITMALVTVWAARSDGGVRIVPADTVQTAP